MNRIILACSLLAFMSSCSSMDAVSAEIEEIKDSCEVTEDVTLYNTYQVSKADNIIIKYSTELPANRRFYLSDCSLIFSNDQENKVFGGYYPDEENAISRIVFFALKREAARISFNLVCNAGNLGSSVGKFVNSSNKQLVISENNGSFSCQVVTDPNSKPMLRPS